MKDNREKILQAALKLFNEKGSSSISTNHICEEAGVSPGNLYYHFRSKDEIIVTIFEELIKHWNSLPLPPMDSAQGLADLMKLGLEFLWEYRFIHREMSSLCRRINKFRETFQRVQTRRLAEITEMIESYQKAGIFREMSSQEIHYLTRTIWFFMVYWLSYLETEGKDFTKENVQESVSILKTIMLPYLTGHLEIS